MVVVGKKKTGQQNEPKQNLRQKIKPEKKNYKDFTSNGKITTHITKTMSDNRPVSLDELIQKRKDEAEKQNKIGFIKRDARASGNATRVVGKPTARSKRRIGGLSLNPTITKKPALTVSSKPPTTEDKPKFDELNILSKIIPTKSSEERAPSAKVVPETPTESASTTSNNNNTNSSNNKANKAKSQKFVFEWNSKDDTLDTSDPLYNINNKPDNTLQHEIESRKRALLEKVAPDALKKPKKSWDDIHWSKKPLDKMRERDWRIFKEDFSILTKGGNIPNPMRSWEESSIPPLILDTVRKIGYKEPTPIQRAAIPVALGLRDVIGVAETGSGKTASFVIPLLSYILELPPLNEVTKTDGPYGIILAPTRELAQQIETETKKFCEPLGFRCASIVGGHSIEEQVHKIKDGAEIIIATPGRLVDCLERRILVLSQCCYVVMDEADRMIDLGFEEQVTAILSALPVTNEKPDENSDGPLQSETKLLGGKHRYRQTMMYTATWPKAIERMAEKYLRRPGIVTIGNAGQATDRVEQRVEFVINDPAKRVKRLLEILQKQKFRPPIIVFVNVKRNCDFVAKSLNDQGWRTVIMHGGKSQDQREAALAQLRAGTADVLVATDVAGRGIDVPNVSLVVNFQMAKSIEDYTHRIGRTGRAGKSGVAITFLSKDDEEVIGDLKQMISRSAVSRMPDELRRYDIARIRPIAQ